MGIKMLENEYHGMGIGTCKSKIENQGETADTGGNTCTLLVGEVGHDVILAATLYIQAGEFREVKVNIGVGNACYPLS